MEASPRINRMISDTYMNQSLKQIYSSSNKEDSRKRTKKFRYSKDYTNTKDCGFPGETIFLSRKHALQIQMLFNVGRWDDENECRDKYPLNSSFGYHRYPFQSRIDPKSTREDSQGVLVEYGVGTVLYFKLVKSLVYIFLVMSILTLPSIILYSRCNVITPVEKKFTSNGPAVLASITIASLGEPIPSCRKAFEGDVFGFSCPGRGTIRSIVTYYGQPSGSCACPLDQQTLEDGSCPAAPQGDTCPNASTGSDTPCFRGQTRFLQTCCSTSQNSKKQADLSSLELRPKMTCNSYTAPHILNHLCLGQSTCSLAIQGNSTVPLESLNGENQSICESISGNTCFTSLNYGGEWSGCDEAANRYLVFEGICDEDTALLDGLQYEHADVVMMASILDGLSMIVFIFGLLWIRHEQEQDIKDLMRGLSRASDYTVLCQITPFLEYFKSIPENEQNSTEFNYSQVSRTISAFFESSLKHCPPVIDIDSSVAIADINLTSCNHEYIREACLRGSLAIRIDKVVNQFIALYRNNKLFTRSKAIRYTQLRNELKQLLFDFEAANIHCRSLQYQAANDINGVFITFEDEEGYQRCLQNFSSKPIFARPAMDPSEIIWENWGYSKTKTILRICGTTAAILFILAFSYLVIFTLQYSGNNFSPVKLTNGFCGTYSVSLSRDESFQRYDSNTITYQKVLWDHSPRFYNMSDYGSNGYLECFCKQINYERGYEEMISYEFYNAARDSKELWCKQVTDARHASMIANYLTTLLIVTINILTRYSLTYLVRFERLEISTYEVISYSLKLFISQYVNTALLALVIYNNLSQLTDSSSSSFPILKSSSFSLGFFSGIHADFDFMWYAAVGSSLTFTMFFYTIGNFIRAAARWLLISLRVLWDQRTDDYKYPFFSSVITHVGSQAELDMLYIGPEFPLELLYGTILAIIYVNMTYSATMPIMNMLTLATLTLTYNFDKYFLLRFYRAPPVYAEFLPRMITNAMYGAACVHCSLAIWMFGNSNIYSPYLHTNVQWIWISSKMFAITSHTWNYKIGLHERLQNPVNSFTLLILILIVAFISFKVLKLFLEKFLKIDSLKFNRFIFDHIACWNGNSVADYKSRKAPYFESIPYETLKYRMESGAAQGEICRRYRHRIRELEDNFMESTVAHLTGLESYNLSFSVEYTMRFGLNTRHMRRVQPLDWIVNRSGKRRSINATAPDHLRRGSVNVCRSSVIDLSDIVYTNPLYDDLEFISEIKNLMQECSPVTGNNGELEMQRLSLAKSKDIHLYNLDTIVNSLDENNKFQRYQDEDAVAIEFLNFSHEFEEIPSNKIEADRFRVSIESVKSVSQYLDV